MSALMPSLRLAIPSKGRLKEQCEAYFADAGLRIEQSGGARGYTARIAGFDDIDVVLMSASEISAGLASGELQAGVTGEDLLRETASDLKDLHLMMPLGFGRARLVVAAPKGWIDVDTMSDVDDVAARYEARTGRRMRVATKYPRQTMRFFSDNGVGHYRIVESAGATEGAPAAGAAELIVDITTTGATLEGNGLKILDDGVILDSQAQLAVGLKARWPTEALDALRALLANLEARDAGRTSRLLQHQPGFDTAKLPRWLADKVEPVAPGEALCDRRDAHRLARAIAEHGGGPVRIRTDEFVFRAGSARFDDFRKRL